MIELLMDGIHLSFWWIMDHLLIINIILSILIIFFQRRNPTTVWTWLLVLYFIPGLGFILYLVLGQNFHKDRMFRMKEIEGQVKYAVRKQGESIYRRELRFRDPELDRYRQLMLYNLNACEAVLTDNNDIRIYTDGKEKFKALLWEMEHARSYIHLQYYIIKRDELWKQIEEVLIRKARQGVEVRVLFDSMGCRTMHNKDWERLEAEGIHVAEFFPAVLGKLQLRVNYRNGEIHISAWKAPQYCRLPSVLFWTGTMRHQRTFSWMTACLRHRTLNATAGSRCRSYPVDRTLTARRSAIITCI